MIDVLVIVMAVVVVALVVGSRRSKAATKTSRRGEVLTALAPVIGGAVDREQTLTGRYGGYDLLVSLHTADPSPPGTAGDSSDRSNVETIRLRLPGVPGAQPWYVWHAPTFTGWRWHFGRPSELLPFAGALTRLTGLPPADPDLPDRLRAAGIGAAFDRLGPPTNDSFPRIQFVPDLRPLMAERWRAKGREIPSSEWDSSPGSWLEVEVERANDREPTPDGFRAVLDGVLAIAEVNARANR